MKAPAATILIPVLVDRLKAKAPIAARQVAGLLAEEMERRTRARLLAVGASS